MISCAFLDDDLICPEDFFHIDIYFYVVHSSWIPEVLVQETHPFVLQIWPAVSH